jgi:hypothetical protein
MAEEFTPIPIQKFTPVPVEKNNPQLVKEESGYEGTTAQDIAEGAFSGIARGLIVEPAKLGLTGLQALFGGEDQSAKLEKSYTDFAKNFGIDPQSGGGKMAERVTGTLAAYIGLGKFTKLAGAKKALDFSAKAPSITQRVKQAAGTSLRFGFAEVIAAPDNTATLADAFDALPEGLRTDNEVKLDSKEDAQRRLLNKFKLGTEAVGLGLAVEAAFPIVGLAVKGASKLNIPGVDIKGYALGVGGLTKAISDSFAWLGSGANKMLGGLPGTYFTSAGATPKAVFEELTDAAGLTKLQATKAVDLLTAFDTELKTAVKGQKLFGKGRLGINKAYNDMFDFMKGSSDSLNQYGTNVVKSATKMRKHIDDLSDDIVTEIDGLRAAGTIDDAYARNLINTIEDQKGQYLTRVYEGAFSKDVPDIIALKIAKSGEYNTAVGKLAQMFGGTDDAVLRATQIIDDELINSRVSSAIVPKDTLKSFTNGLKYGKDQLGDKPLYTIAEGIFKERSKKLYEIPEFRSLLNEYKNPLTVYVNTIDNMSKSITSARLYKGISDKYKITADDALSQIAKGARPLVVDGKNLSPAQAFALREKGWTQLGEYVPQKPIGSVLDGPASTEIAEEAAEKLSVFGGKYGALSGDFVAPEIYNSLTIPLRGGGLLNNVMGSLLQLKGLAQLGKTVLNPLAQVRNFTGGSIMVGMNGNVGRGLNLAESAHLTFNNFAKLNDDEAVKIAETISKLGLKDESLATSEINSLIQDGAGFGGKSGLMDLVQKVPLVAPLSKLYGNTDTYWKTVGWFGERAKYHNALRRAGVNIDDIAEDLIESNIVKRSSSSVLKDVDTLDILAGDIVKDTMPIYSRVPLAIQALRKTPIFGAFASFPAETIRNVGNILSRGVDEMGFVASQNLINKIGAKAARKLESEIRAIGAGRLSGFISSATVLPQGAALAALKMTGMDAEELQAAVRSYLPVFMQGHTILPLAKPYKDKNGKLTFEYVDLSYFLPLDFLLAPARAAMDMYNKNGMVDRQGAGIIAEGAYESFKMWMDPFAGESLVAERFLDVTVRGGKTSLGAKIYNKEGAFGTNFNKGLVHVLNGFNPSIVEQFVKPSAVGPQGELTYELGRTGRALATALTGEEYPDKYGQVNNLTTELLNNLTGIRTSKVDFGRSLFFKGAEFTRTRSSLITDFLGFVDDANITEEQAKENFKFTNDLLFKEQQKLYATIQDGKRLGLSDYAIFNALKKEAKLGADEFDLIANGLFRPFKPGDSTFTKVLERRWLNNEPGIMRELPEAAFIDIYNSMVGKSLKGSSVQEAPQFKPEIKQNNQPPAFVPKPVNTNTNIFVPKPVSSNAIKSSPTTDISLLGSNPIDAMKNQQIAQRRTV